MISTNTVIELPDKWDGWSSLLTEDGIDYAYDFIAPDQAKSLEQLLHIKTHNDKVYSLLLSRGKYFDESVAAHVVDPEDLVDLVQDYTGRTKVCFGPGSGKTTKLKLFCVETDSPMLIGVTSNEEVKKLTYDIKALMVYKLSLTQTSPVERTVIDNVDLIQRFSDPVLYKVSPLFRSEQSDESLKNGRLDYFNPYQIVVTNSWHLSNQPIEIFSGYEHYGTLGHRKNKSKYAMEANDQELSTRKYLIIDEVPGTGEVYDVTLLDFITVYTQFYQSCVVGNDLSHLTLEEQLDYSINQVAECSAVNGLGHNLNVPGSTINNAGSPLLAARVGEILFHTLYKVLIDYCSAPTPMGINELARHLHGMNLFPIRYSKSVASYRPHHTVVLDGTGYIHYRDESTVWDRCVTKYLKPIDTTYVSDVDLPFSRKDDINIDGISQLIASIKSKVSEFNAKALADGKPENMSKRILIATYMTLDSNSVTTTALGEVISSQMHLENFTISKNGRDLIDFPKLLESLLNTGKEVYKVIHYQGAEVRETNKYMDYDTAILLGRFNIPGDALPVYNTAEGLEEIDTRKYPGVKISQDTYPLPGYVQFLFRTRARRGLPINLLLSQDLLSSRQGVKLLELINVSNRVILENNLFSLDELLTGSTQYRNLISNEIYCRMLYTAKDGKINYYHEPFCALVEQYTDVHPMLAYCAIKKNFAILGYNLVVEGFSEVEDWFIEAVWESAGLDKLDKISKLLDFINWESREVSIRLDDLFDLDPIPRKGSYYYRRRYESILSQLDLSFIIG